MFELIVLAISNLLTALLTAWIIHCAKTQRNPIQFSAGKVAASSPDNGDANGQTFQPKGQVRL